MRLREMVGEMMGVQLVERLRVQLASVALDEALVVGLLVGHCPDVVELLVDVVHGVQLLEFEYSLIDGNIICILINLLVIIIQNII